jgi:hypothetical protein
MRNWEAVLRRDSAAWDDFKAWLTEMDAQTLEGLMTGRESNISYLQGKVAGIRAVRDAATANEREENARARTGR